MAGEKILIAEDEDLMRNILAKLLSQEGYETFAASNGEEAFQIFQAEEIDLLLTDIRMPGMDGYAMLKRLKRDYPDLPVVAISGVEEGREVAQYDFAGFFEKPVRIDVFRALIDELVER